MFSQLIGRADGRCGMRFPLVDVAHVTDFFLQCAGG